jgi:hypothetical protein
VDYNRILRMVDIRPDGRNVSGTVSSAKDMDGRPSWTISRYENGILYAGGDKGSRQLKVLRSSDGELILQEDHITYFFKQFR